MTIKYGYGYGYGYGYITACFIKKLPVTITYTGNYNILTNQIHWT
jgi:hypothetical protein